MARAFAQVDVFSEVPFGGNPVAVVLDGAGLDEDTMQRFAHWTNLSETTFVSAPTQPGADYRVRIFTPVAELPFAGHPTLGTCHAWLAAGGRAAGDGVVVQECRAGLIAVRRTGGRLAFAAPPLLRYEAVEEALLGQLAAMLAIGREQILDSHWVDNGPGWVAVELGGAQEVLAVRPGPLDGGPPGMKIGVVGAHAPGSPQAFEVRAFFPKDGAAVEDPVTGSLNASVAQWLLDRGRASAPYVVSQGTALGRSGRVHISRDEDGTIWVGGATVTRIAGEAEV